MTHQWLRGTWAEAMERLHGHKKDHKGVLLFADHLKGQDVRPCGGALGRQTQKVAAEYHLQPTQPL